MTTPRAFDPRGLRAGVVALLAATWPLVPGAVVGQQRPVEAPTPATSPAPPLSISPGGAFLRALAVPGWGHAAIGSYTRGGVYFAAQSTTLYTLFRTRIRVGESQDRVRLREGILRARLDAEGITAPEDVQARFDEDPALTELRGLLGARKSQQEDLVAFGIFLLFLSGADAYVSAHLARFPDPLEIEGAPVEGGGFELGLRMSSPW
jgi:hypothetical protein